MTIKNITLLALLFWCAKAQAQGIIEQATIEIGAESKSKTAPKLEQIAHQTDQYIYLIKSQYAPALSNLLVEQYDMDLNLVASNPLAFENKELKQPTWEKAFVSSNGQLYVLYSKKDKNIEGNRYYKRSFNEDSLQFDVAETSVGSIEYAEKVGRTSFEVKQSSDKRRFLIYSALDNTVNKCETFGLHVLDENLDSLWQKQVEMPYTNQAFRVEQCEVDNEGNCYIIGRMEKEGRESRELKKNGKATYDYRVLKYRHNQEVPEEYTIDLGGYFLTDMEIAIQKNGNIVGAGLYSGADTLSAWGSFGLTINTKTNTVENKKLSKFDLDLVINDFKKSAQNKIRKKQEAGQIYSTLNNYRINALVIKKDGGVQLVAEQHYTFYTAYSSTEGDNKHGVYNDILVIDMDSLNQVNWITRIPKRQTAIENSPSTPSYSYKMLEKKEQLYFVFNENCKNFKNTRKIRKGKRHLLNYTTGHAIPTIVELDARGKQSRWKLYDNNEPDWRLSIMKGIITDEGQLLFSTFLGTTGRSRLVRIELK